MKILLLLFLSVIMSGCTAAPRVSQRSFDKGVWQSKSASVSEKADYVAAFFENQRATLVNVNSIIGIPESDSRTGNDVDGTGMRYDTFYRFENGTIVLTFLAKPNTEKHDSILYSVWHKAHKGAIGIYGKGTEQIIKKSQQSTAELRR